MKIKYLLDSYFPTEKAYGVTTENTLRSLAEFGHEVTLFCFRPSLIQLTRIEGINIVYFKISLMNRVFRHIGLKGYGKVSMICWNISKYLTLYENREELDIKENELVWTRELPIPRKISSAKHGMQVIEIHNPPSKRQVRILKGTLTEKTILCPISKSLESQIHKLLPSRNIVWAPMGIETETRQKEEISRDIRDHYTRISEPITIGYFGKLAPNGKSKGFEDLLDLGVELSRRKIQFRLKFVGARESEVPLLENAIRDRGLGGQAIERQIHLPHHVSLQVMKSCDFLILPANRDLRYQGFPLKALEYVNAIRIVVAAKTKSNSEVFTETFQPFWYEPGDVDSLANLVAQKINLVELESYLIKGWQYSSKFSWSMRTQKILEKLDSIES